MCTNHALLHKLPVGVDTGPFLLQKTTLCSMRNSTPKINLSWFQSNKIQTTLCYDVISITKRPNMECLTYEPLEVNIYFIYCRLYCMVQTETRQPSTMILNARDNSTVSHILSLGNRRIHAKLCYIDFTYSVSDNQLRGKTKHSSILNLLFHKNLIHNGFTHDTLSHIWLC